MLRVVDLLALPLFENFRLITNGDGLYNKVNGVGVLDWETPEEIRESFNPGDMVFTTQFMNEGDHEVARDSLKELIRHSVGALAIKTTDALNHEKLVRDNDLGDLIELAGRARIPVFSYEETYIEDLIYVVRRSIEANDSNGIALAALREMMSCEEDQVVALAHKLNPMFKDNLLCLCCIPSANAPSVGRRLEDVLDEALDSYRKTLPMNIPNREAHHSLIRCEKCILIIHTDKRKLLDNEATDKKIAFAREILKEFNLDEGSFHIGISATAQSLMEVKRAVDEAVTAAIDAMVKAEKLQTIEGVGGMALIVPSIRSAVFEDFYEDGISKLREYDASHDTDLVSTLMAYTESDWDIGLTAAKLYQHSNTIRYRIRKIRAILGADEGPDGQMQLTVLAKMHKIYSLLGDSKVI